jgi:hypothetical protein
MAKRLTRAEILAQIPAARARGAEERRAGLYADDVSYDRRSGRLVLELTNGYQLRIPVSSLPDLADATQAQLAAVELGPEGHSLWFEELDADYSVPGLVLSLGMREAGRQGGSVTSEAKAEAARKNGARGGRPRKAAAGAKKRDEPLHR